MDGAAATETANSVQLIYLATKYKIMITKNAHMLIAAGFMRSPSDDL